MASRAPLVRYSPQRNSEFLRCYWRANQSGTLTDSALPTKTYTQNSLNLVAVPLTPPWKFILKNCLQAVSEGDITAVSAPISTQTIDFSFCIRFFVETLGAPVSTMILFTNGTKNTDGYTLQIVNNSGSFDLELYDEAGKTANSLGSAVTEGQWYTLGLRVNFSQRMNVWLDGTQIAEINVNLTAPTSSTFWFGGGPGNTGSPFLGYMSEFIFYDTSLPTSYFTNISPNSVFAGK